MHGFVLQGVALMMRGKIEQAVMFMVFAINFKQMALYFAIPFGVLALAKIYHKAYYLFGKN